MATQTPPKDTPFGLEPNVAAGLAYLFGFIGGIVMLAGGGSNKFVRWAAAQSIVLSLVYMVVWFVLNAAYTPLYGAGFGLRMLLMFVLWVAFVAAWLWTFITAFQGKIVRVPVIASLTDTLFKSML